ncbi:hypothetical protein [Reinekea sp. G2M2-21]|uniref:hypothetical protein n=1 Tax=Reinekea sp. G2M2-21 TaxID=2788942 RepID=UPI0018AB574B|nr:hypothetical protein [Reinekea sp. G2M2-21]
MRSLTAVLLISISVAYADMSAWVVDGTLNSVVADEKHGIFYGGSFTSIGPVSGPMATTKDGQRRRVFPEIIGTVLDAVYDGDQYLYIGGDFTLSYTSADIYNLVRYDWLKGDFDYNWQPNPNKHVTSLAVSEHGLFVGGYYDHIAGLKAKGFVKFDTHGKIDRVVYGGLDRVNKVLLHKDDILVGSYGTDNNSDALLAYKQDTLGRSWSSNIERAIVFDMAFVENSLFLIGPSESHYSFHFALFDLDTKVLKDIDFKIEDHKNLYSVAASDSHVYVTGSFNSVNGRERKGVVQLDLSGKVTDWTPPTLSKFDRLSATVLNGQLFLTGNFKTNYSIPVGPLQRWDINSTTSLPIPKLEGDVNSIIKSSDHILIGGNFRINGSTSLSQIAWIDSYGEVVNRGPSFHGNVSSIVKAGDQLWVRGSFLGLERYWCPGLVVLSDEGNPLHCPTFDGEVYDVSSENGEVYVAGSFTEFNGIPADGFVKLNSDFEVVQARKASEIKSDWIVRKSVHLNGNTYIDSIHLTGESTYSRYIELVQSDFSIQTILTHNSSLAGASLDNKNLLLHSPNAMLVFDPNTKVSKQLTMSEMSEYSNNSLVLPFEDGYLVAGQRRNKLNDLYGTYATDSDERSSIDSIVGLLTGKVKGLLISHDELWIAGSEFKSKTRPVNKIIMVDIVTNTISGGFGLAPSGSVLGAIMVEDHLLVFGDSQTYISHAISALVRTDANGIPDQDWALNRDLSDIVSMILYEDSLFVCSKKELARVDLEIKEVVWSKPVRFQPNDKCKLAVHNNSLYLASSSEVQGSRSYLRRLSLDGEVIEEGLSTGKVEVLSLDAENNELILAGEFEEIMSQPRLHAAIIDAEGKLTDWNSKNLDLTHKSFYGAHKFAGSYHFTGSLNFRNRDLREHSNLFALDDFGEIVSRGNVKRLDSSFTATAVHKGYLLLSGYFDAFSKEHKSEESEQPMYGLAAYSNGQFIENWNPGVPFRYANQLAVLGDKLYLAWSSLGYYPRSSYKNLQPRKKYASLSPIQLDGPFDSNPNSKQSTGNELK